MSAALIERMLRAPADVASDCREDRGTRAIALTSIAAIFIGSAVFGAVIGTFRGGVQVAYAAAKVPIAMLLTLAICAPAFYAMAATFGRAWPARAVMSLALAAAGRAALLLLALAPVLWLVIDLGAGYHGAVLAAAVAYGAAGAAALRLLVHGLGPGRLRWLTTAGFVLVFVAVGGQTSWILRPYLVRPQTEEVPFLRAREGGFADALWTSGRSARGIYDRGRR